MGPLIDRTRLMDQINLWESLFGISGTSALPLQLPHLLVFASPLEAICHIPDVPRPTVPHALNEEQGAWWQTSWSLLTMAMEATVEPAVAMWTAHA